MTNMWEIPEGMAGILLASSQGKHEEVLRFCDATIDRLHMQFLKAPAQSQSGKAKHSPAEILETIAICYQLMAEANSKLKRFEEAMVAWRKLYTHYRTTSAAVNPLSYLQLLEEVNSLSEQNRVEDALELADMSVSIMRKRIYELSRNMDSGLPYVGYGLIHLKHTPIPWQENQKALYALNSAHLLTLSHPSGETGMGSILALARLGEINVRAGKLDNALNYLQKAHVGALLAASAERTILTRFDLHQVMLHLVNLLLFYREYAKCAAVAAMSLPKSALQPQNTLSYRVFQCSHNHVAALLALERYTEAAEVLAPLAEWLKLCDDDTSKQAQMTRLEHFFLASEVYADLGQPRLRCS
eukprot:m.249042 g.249042  ORF g.249042 m.249042 type:complete len:357 (+) comp64300_c0_seq1:523-1593(+)